MSDLIAFLNARLDETERIAKEASRDHRGYTPTGEHWQWEDSSTDEVYALDPMTDEYVGDGANVSLRSREQYPTDSVGPLPHFVVGDAEEVGTVVGMHIVRHDPAHVLADVAAKRTIVEQAEVRLRSYVGTGAQVAFEWSVLRLLALPYRDHPDWREDWAAVSVSAATQKVR